MSVTTTVNLSFNMFPGDIQKMLGVDGYFQGSGTVVGDGSGGFARIVLQEPEDVSWPQRALWFVTAFAQRNSGTGDGIINMVGKTATPQGDEWTTSLILGSATSGARPYDGVGRAISNEVKERGWVVPADGLNLRSAYLSFSFPNDAGAPTWEAKCFGYYLMLGV